MGLNYILYLSALIFVIGLFVVITRKNAIMVLIGIELMLNAANLNLMAFSSYDNTLQGQIFSIFLITVAAAEAAVALAIVVKVYNYFRTADLDKINQLKG